MSAETIHPEPVNPLSEDQVKVLRMLASGFTTVEIADRLYVSPSAVTMRVNRAKRAMGMNTAIQLVFEAGRRGYLAKRKS